VRPRAADLGQGKAIPPQIDANLVIDVDLQNDHTCRLVELDPVPVSGAILGPWCLDQWLIMRLWAPMRMNKTGTVIVKIFAAMLV
jgi:hypothetical protein